MAIIYSYALDTEILGTDILVGTCTVLVGGQSRNQTKSFSVSGLNTYMSINNPLLTTKGDLYTRSDVNARLGVGTNGQLLSADSTQTTGLKWINAPVNGVTAVTATSPITSSGGTTPIISTSMATNKLIGRSTAGTGVMEQITIGSGLTLSGGTLTASGASPLTTKGDLYTYSTTNARLGVGSSGQVLMADAAAVTGLRWATLSITGITSLNGLTSAAQTFSVGTTGTNFAINSTGTVHTFNLPDASSTARGVITTGAQDINGTKNFLTDIIVNGVNIGAGPGNSPSNVRIGQGAGASLGSVFGSGYDNILVGAFAGNGQTGNGSTIIGGKLNPQSRTFNQNSTLSIGKISKVDIPADGALPHIWAPEFSTIDYNTSSIILIVSQLCYSALFIDYVISYNDVSLRAGTIKAVWDKNGVVKWTEETTDSIKDMSGCNFEIVYDNIDRTMNLRLSNPSVTDKLYCNFTSRLLTKPKLY